jgi:hypothetical protein
MLNIMSYYLMINFWYYLYSFNNFLALERATIITWKSYIHLWVNKLQSSCTFITFMLKDEHRLILGILMHVKCIHELYSLLDHIP